MAKPDWAVEIDWDDDESYAHDETSRVLDFSCRYGRSDELGVPHAGRATIVLRNSGGRFTPEKTNGPLYGDLEALRRIRIKATFDGTPYPLFTGFISGIEPRPKSRTCILTCEDLFMFLRAYDLSTAVWEDKTTSWLVTAILTLVGVDGGDMDINTGQTTLPYAAWRNTDALTAIQQVADSELGGMFYVAADGKATFEDRHLRPKQALAATLDNVARDIRYDRREDQVFSRAVLQAAGFEEGAAGSQVWSLLPLPREIGAGETLELSVNYPFIVKDSIEPAPGTDWAATADQAGEGADKTAQVELDGWVQYGGGAALGLKNNDSSSVWLQRCKIRGTPLQRPSELRTVTRTAEGGIGPLTKTYTKSFPFISDPVLLEAYAEYIVERYKTPQPQLRVTLLAKTDAILTQQLARQVSDRVHIIDDTQDWQTQVDGEHFIEAVEHRGAPNRALETKWTLGSKLADQLWILDTDKLAISTVLRY